MKLLESIESKITKKKKKIVKMFLLQITKIVLIHCNMINNSYQQKSRVLHIFFSNKSFRQLLKISPENFMFLKTLDSEFSYTQLKLADKIPLL